MLSPTDLSDEDDDLLPNDENDIERIIRDRENDSEDGGGFRSDEAEEDNGTRNEDDVEGFEKRRIDPNAVKKRVGNPQPKLNAQRLNGPNGIQTIEKYFDGFKFHGKGFERSDLKEIMKRLEHWSHRLFPKYRFDDCLEKIEKLGAKKEVQTHLKKIRLGMIEADDGSTRNDDGDVEDERMEDSAPIDEFDALIAEQIERQKQFATPQRPTTSGANTSPFTNSASKSTPAVSKPDVEITAEMKERIERNRQMAIQKRLARIQAMEEEANKKAQEEQRAPTRLEIAEVSSIQMEADEETKLQEDIDADLEATPDEMTGQE